MNKKYNSRYRNSENTNRLGGKLLELGRAIGIVAMALYGFDVSLEAASTNERERIFRLAACYALSETRTLRRSFLMIEFMSMITSRVLWLLGYTSISTRLRKRVRFCNGTTVCINFA